MSLIYYISCLSRSYLTIILLFCTSHPRTLEYTTNNNNHCTTTDITLTTTTNLISSTTPTTPTTPTIISLPPPFPLSPPFFTTAFFLPGALVTVVDRADGWFFVHTLDGEKGWAPAGKYREYLF